MRRAPAPRSPACWRVARARRCGPTSAAGRARAGAGAHAAAAPDGSRSPTLERRFAPRPEAAALRPRAASGALRRRDGAAARSAERRALRAQLRRGARARAVRCARCGRLPPRRSAARPPRRGRVTLEYAPWTTSTSSSGEAPRCSRPGTTTRPRSRSARARDLAPDKTSIREALGRALFHAQRYEQAAAEFQAVIDRAPTNDYALFCLGRSCSCSAVTPRRASRWRWPRACSPTGATTALPGPRPGPRGRRASGASAGSAPRVSWRRAPSAVLRWTHSFRAGRHPGGSTGSGRSPAFFYDSDRRRSDSEANFRPRSRPGLRQPSPRSRCCSSRSSPARRLRLFIDHPDGVTLALCERVSGPLSDYRERYALEVSSPGQDRPLTKPAALHQLPRPARARAPAGGRDGQRADRRTRRRLRPGSTIAAGDGVVNDPQSQAERGRRSGRRPRASRSQRARGTQERDRRAVGASDAEVTIAAADGVLTIPYEQIARSNLVPGD